MYFIRKKKHQRDQQAGLIFHWRGFRKHHLGKMIALLVVSGFFAFSVYAIKIDVLKTPLLSKKEGVVIMLDVDDPNCRALLLQVEERSPFPARWDPVMDMDVRHRLDEAQRLLEGGLLNYQMNMQALPEEQLSHGLVSIMDSKHILSGYVQTSWPQKHAEANVMERKDLFIKAKVHSGGELQTRIAGEELALPADLVTDEGYGQVYRFQLGLDRFGFVSACIPLTGGSRDITKITDRQRKLAAWLRTQRFSPAGSEDKEMVIGQLELQIKALRE